MRDDKTAILLYLPETHAEILAWEARRRGKSRSALIREILARWIDRTDADIRYALEVK